MTILLTIIACALALGLAIFLLKVVFMFIISPFWDCLMEFLSIFNPKYKKYKYNVWDRIGPIDDA